MSTAKYMIAFHRVWAILKDSWDLNRESNMAYVVAITPLDYRKDCVCVPHPVNHNPKSIRFNHSRASPTTKLHKGNSCRGEQNQPVTSVHTAVADSPVCEQAFRLITCKTNQKISFRSFYKPAASG